MNDRFAIAIPIDDGSSILGDEPMLWFTGDCIWHDELALKYGERLPGPLHMKLMHHYFLPITYLRVIGPALQPDVIESSRL